MTKHSRSWRAGTAALLLAAGCGDSRDPSFVESLGGPADEAARPGPATARWDVVDLLREAALFSDHPSDGGGRAWLDPPVSEPVPAASPARFGLHFEVGPLGIAPGGAVYLQVSPFWDWSTPQVVDASAPGFTEISSDPADLEWEAETLDQGLLALVNTGEAWPPGARFSLDYGAGIAGALTDRYAERDSRFWFAVDGDGDGHRRLLDDSPAVDVAAGAPVELQLTAPSLVRPGERFRLSAAWLDAQRNAGTHWTGDLHWEERPAGLELPESVRVEAADRGAVWIEGVAREPGLYRLALRAGDRLARANPLQVDARAPRVLWADLHGHSGLSDGTGTPEDYYTYARDVSALDVAALTDHDHWGMQPLAEHAELWERIRAATRSFHDPGRFVTLLGFEWTSWIHGHRHVLWFGDAGAVVDSLAEASDSPEELWAALDAQGETALTFAHHPAGGPVAVNWDVPPHPRYEPVTEIVSIHGSSEAADSPGPIYDPVPGHYVRDALDRGYRLGFVGSGDSHDGHPGAYGRDPVEGGVAAILAEERSREAVLQALRERRVYATNGPRILLRTALDDVPMGGTLELAPGELRSGALFVRAVGVEPLDRIELIRSGRVIDGLDLEGQLEVALHREVEGLTAGEYVYVRVVQRDGGAAWSSPIFAEAQRAPAQVPEPAETNPAPPPSALLELPDRPAPPTRRAQEDPPHAS